MDILVLLFALVLSVSFLCSILESILLSTNMTYISILERKSPSTGKLLKKLKNNIDESIASILILNTFANTLGATAIGVQAQNLFQHNSNLILVVTILLTFLILFFAEIVPKTIGAVYWKQLAPIAAKLIRIFIFITYPIIVMTLFVTKKINKDNDSEQVSREDILHSALLSEEDGIIDDMESDIIENTLTLKAVKVKDILTPRSVMFAVQKDTIIKDLLKNKDIYRFSRVPVYDKDIDDIVGMILTKKLFKHAVTNRKVRIENIMVDICTINENIPVSKALSNFIKIKAHMFIVVDGYDQTEGLVTLEDCIETLLGLEIMDELDSTEDMRILASNKMRENRKSREH